MIENWQLLKERKMLEAVPFNVLRRDYLRPDKKGEFNAFVLQMPDWVNIIAYNAKNEVLLIRQFRFGSSNVELEIPGGCIEEGEEPLAAAKRELKEETGYEGDDWEFLGVVDSNPAVQTNKCYTFRCKVGEKGTTNFDENEIIESEFVAKEKVRDFIRSGKITNTYIIAAFFWEALKDELS